MDQVGHRCEKVGAIDPAPVTAQNQVVARTAPARLLGHVDFGHAVLGEVAPLLCDDQGGGVGQGDVPEFDPLNFRPHGLGAGDPR